MTKPRKVEVLRGKQIRYAEPEVVRRAAGKLFKFMGELMRRLADYERAEKKKS